MSLAPLVNKSIFHANTTLPGAIWRLVLASLATYSRCIPSCAAGRQRVCRGRCCLERLRGCSQTRLRGGVDALELRAA